MTDYIVNEKGQEVISDRHQKDYVKEDFSSESSKNDEVTESFIDVNFDDI